MKKYPLIGAIIALSATAASAQGYTYPTGGLGILDRSCSPALYRAYDRCAQADSATKVLGPSRKNVDWRPIPVSLRLSLSGYVTPSAVEKRRRGFADHAGMPALSLNPFANSASFRIHLKPARSIFSNELNFRRSAIAVLVRSP
jgi:hypothetical protein